MADDILINIRTVGVDQVQRASAEIAKMGAVSETLVGKMSASSRMILRQVQASKSLSATKSELQRAVKQNIITQGQMNQAMKEAHRQARTLVATDKELIAQEKEKLRIQREAEAKQAKHLAYVDELRRKYDAQYQQEVSLNQTKSEYNTLLQAGAINQEEFNHLIAKAEQEARDFEAALAKGGNQFGRFNLEAYRSAQTLKRQVNAQIQQAGYQVGDFFVQIQSGTDIFVAFGQQASQLAGAFNQIGRFSGPMVGAFIAIGTAAATMATQLYKAWTNTQDLDEAIDELAENRQKVEELFKLLQDGPEAIADKFTIATTKIKEMSLALAEVDLDKLNRTNIAGVSDFTGQGYLGASFAAINQRFDQSLNGLGKADRKNLTDQANAIMSAFAGAEGDPLKRYEEFKRLGELIKSYGGELPEEFLDAEKALNRFAQEHDRLTLSIKNLKAEISGVQYETGFSRALREGAIDVNSLLPPKEGTQFTISRQAGADLIREQNIRRMAELEDGLANASSEYKIQRAKEEGAERVAANAAATEAILQHNRAAFAKLENDLSSAYQEERNKRFKAEAAAAQARYNEEVERARAAFAAMEEDRVNAHEEGIRKRIDKETELRKQRQKELEQQEKVNDAAEVANRILAQKNDLLAAEAEFGKDSQKYRDAFIEAEAEIARIKGEQKGLSGQLLSDSIALAVEAAKNKFSVADAADEARRLATELKDAERAMNTLTSVGDSVAMALIKARAQVAAQKAGKDTGVAGTIAGERERNRRARDAALANGKVDAGLANAQYAQTEANIAELETALAILAANKGKKKESDYEKMLKKYKEYRDNLEFEVNLQEKLGMRLGEERDLQEQLLNLKNEYALIGKFFDEEEIERLLRKKQAMEKVQQVAKTIESSMEQAFMSIVDGTKTVEQAFKDMASSIIKELYRIYVVKKTTGMIMDIIDFATGAPPGSSSSILGAKAGGGYVQAGGKYIVGERGPEVFTAPSNGYITPNKDLGTGGTTIVQNLNISTGVSQTVRSEIRQMMPQISAAAKSAVVDSKRRGGNYGKSL